MSDHPVLLLPLFPFLISGPFEVMPFLQFSH